MAWNEPGGGNRDPWSGSGRDQRPPDLNDLLNRLQDKVRRLMGGKPSRSGGSGSSAVGISLIFIVIALVWLASGFYVVDQGNRGVVLRFGEFSEVTMPGPHWHLPYPIEQVRKVNVEAIRSVEIGYESGAGDRSRQVLDEALMLTKDENIVNVQLAVQYLVNDPKRYLFNFREPDRTLKELTESALREVVGKHSMDFVLTEGRAEVIEETRSLVQAVLERYEAGLHVDKVVVRDIQPPEEVQSAFADAIHAREDEQRLINKAETYRNEVVPHAKGEAYRILEEASGYKTRVIAEAQGESDRFLSLLDEYRKAPEVTRERLYLDTIESVLQNTSKVLVGSEGTQPLFYLPLDKMMNRETGGAAAPVPSADAAASTSPSAAESAANQRDRGTLRSREAR